VIAGVIVKASQDQVESRCEIELSEPLPADTAVGKNVGALIGVGEMPDVVFFGRPADSSPNTNANIFVLEPEGTFARRVAVRYGKISGPLIQVVQGLAPGDRVIVTGMSKWAEFARVRIQ
jgi:HlyD family secretion protein